MNPRCLVPGLTLALCASLVLGCGAPAEDEPWGDHAASDPSESGAAPDGPLGKADGEEGLTNPLSVPYFYQYANAHEPGATCGITSAAMLLRYWGKSATPDQLYVDYGKAKGQSPESLASLYRDHGLNATYSRTGTVAQIKAQLDAGRPVVVHGWFTSAGHVVLFVGYDATGWYVNDPAGKWAGCAGCGYPERTSTNGRSVHYSYASMREAISFDGDIWMSVAAESEL